MNTHEFEAATGLSVEAVRDRRRRGQMDGIGEKRGKNWHYSSEDVRCVEVFNTFQEIIDGADRSHVAKLITDSVKNGRRSGNAIIDAIIAEHDRREFQKRCTEFYVGEVKQ